MTCLPYYIGVSYPWNIIFFLINMASSLTSVSGNSLTIFIIITRQHLHLPQNLLLAALSATDLFAGLVPQPIYATYLSFYHNSNNCGIEQAIVFMSATSCSASLLLLCAIARERHRQLILGLSYNEDTSKGKIFGIAMVSWTISLVVASTFMISVPGPLEYSGFGTFSTVQLFSFVYISYKYYKIRRIVVQHYNHMRQIMEMGDSNQQISEADREKRHNRTLLMILCVFVAVWFPFMIILISGTAYQARGQRPGSWLQYGFIWTAILTYVNGAINPFIYAIRYKEIGDEMKQQFRKIISCYARSSSTVQDVGSS